MRSVKDRLVQYPRRYKLKHTNSDSVLGEFDLEPIPGEIIEEGTPINSALFNDVNADIRGKVSSQDGDLKDTVVTFSDVSGDAGNLTSGEKTSVFFGKIKNWLGRLKKLAFKDKITDSEIDDNSISQDKIKDLNSTLGDMVTSVDGENGDVETKAVKYIVQKPTDSEKKTAQNNVKIVQGKLLSEVGWYRVALLNVFGLYEVTISHRYNNNAPIPLKIFVCIGYKDKRYVSLSSIGGGGAVFTKARLNYAEDKIYLEIYNSLPSSENVGIGIKSESYADEFSDFELIDFEKISSTGSVIAEISLINGINTTGIICENANQVVSSNPDTTLTFEQQQTVLKKIGAVYSHLQPNDQLDNGIDNENLLRLPEVGTILDKTTSKWYNLINLRHAGGTGSDGIKYGAQIFSSMTDNVNSVIPLYYRRQVDGVWSSPETILKIDPTKLIPSIENGWTQGSLATNLSAFESGLYVVATTSVSTSVINNYSNNPLYDFIFITKGNGRANWKYSIGYQRYYLDSSGSSISGTSDAINGSYSNITAATLWFKRVG